LKGFCHLGYNSIYSVERQQSFQRNILSPSFNGLHGIVPQEIELCITTNERTSNPILNQVIQKLVKETSLQLYLGLESDSVTLHSHAVIKNFSCIKCLLMELYKFVNGNGKWELLSYKRQCVNNPSCAELTMLLAMLYAHLLAHYVSNKISLKSHELLEKTLIKPNFHWVFTLFQSDTYFRFVSKSK
jgi:hypothetical protein